MVGEDKSTHQLDTLNSGGSVRTGMDSTTTGEFGQGSSQCITSTKYLQKQMSRLLKRKQVNNALLGFVQMVKEENVAGEVQGEV